MTLDATAAGFAGRLAAIHQRIAQACSRAGRTADSVRLLAVSKKVDAAAVAEAVRAGQVDFGENYVQEGAKKIDELAAIADLPARPVFDLIGPLQRNKVKKAVGVFGTIQTVDRIELASEIDRIAAARGVIQPVLVQVNVSGEQSKSGTAPSDLAALVQKIRSMASIDLRGLMSIGSYIGESEADALRRSEFKLLRRLRDETADRTGLALPELSMGMSHDFELAIEEGATIVRVGTALFGERQLKTTKLV